ncbi:MAG: hypothetical protein ABIR68_19150, partial [Ilumatobacteraceae bacterium]
MPGKRHGFGKGVVAAALAAGVAVVVPALTSDNAAHADSNSVEITEFMASNKSTVAGTCPVSADWIELHNTSGSPASLHGMHLTDDPANAVEWAFPADTADIPGGGLRIVCVNVTGDPSSPTFGLSNSGEYLALTNSAGALVGPSYAFPAQFDDVSYGTGGGGTGVGYMTTPTPGAANNSAVPQLSRLPRPTLSPPGGYYGGSVTVVATGSGTLRYTTNNKTPKSTDTAFPGGGLSVAPGTIVRVAAFQTGSVPSTEASGTYLSIAGVLAQPTTPPSGWPASGATKGQSFVYGFDGGQVAANGAAISAALTSVPTLSIVTDLKNLTDPATGVYVNAVQSGSSWERGSSIEYIDPANPNGSFQINAGLRIKGGYGRQPQFPRHGFSLRFTDSYDGRLTTPAPLFADGIRSFASLDLRAENNASWPWGSARSTQLREIWTRD